MKKSLNKIYLIFEIKRMEVKLKAKQGKKSKQKVAW